MPNTHAQVSPLAPPQTVLDLGPVTLLGYAPSSLNQPALFDYARAYLAETEPETISRLSVLQALISVGRAGFDAAPLPPLEDPLPDIESSIGY